MAVQKVMVSFTEQQIAALETLMTEDMASNRSAYIARLIADEIKRREINAQ